MQVHNYEKLIVWQKSMEVVTKIYQITKEFPKEELYGLTSQMRRCAVSIPSNISEGSRRKTQKDFAHFLTISFGSGAELETQIKIAKNLKFVSIEEYEDISEQLEEIMKMLNVLIEKYSNV